VIQGLLVLVILIVFLLSIVGDKGTVELSRVREQEAKLTQEIGELKRQKGEWLKKLQSLKGSREYLGSLAREELGYIKKDEFLLLPEVAPLAPILSASPQNLPPNASPDSGLAAEEEAPTGPPEEVSSP